MNNNHTIQTNIHKKKKNEDMLLFYSVMVT